MTDHGKCTTCGRDMHPASRYGGLCWECYDADGKRKDAEIRVLRAALNLAILWLEMYMDNPVSRMLSVLNGDEYDIDKEMLRRIFDE